MKKISLNTRLKSLLFDGYLERTTDEHEYKNKNKMHHKG